jgi:hypothetical protein
MLRQAYDYIQVAVIPVPNEKHLFYIPFTHLAHDRQHVFEVKTNVGISGHGCSQNMSALGYATSYYEIVREVEVIKVSARPRRGYMSIK